MQIRSKMSKQFALCSFHTVFNATNAIHFLQETEKAKEQVKKALGVLNGHLSKRTFLVGERISQADIAVACNLLQLYKYVRNFSIIRSILITKKVFLKFFKP